MEPWIVERGEGQIDSRDSWGRSQLWQSHQEGLFVCAMYSICSVQGIHTTMHCLVLCAALGLRERTQEGLTARGSLLLRRKEEYVMLMMTTEISLMSQGFYSGSSAFQFVSSGKLGWVTSERLNCVNWPLLVFKAWTCNNMNGVSKGPRSEVGPEETD